MTAEVKTTCESCKRRTPVKLAESIRNKDYCIKCASQLNFLSLDILRLQLKIKQSGLRTYRGQKEVRT